MSTMDERRLVTKEMDALKTMDETQPRKQARRTQHVIVVVGVGEAKKEIPCDKASLLSIGSTYFESLFNSCSRMKEASENHIRLPQFAPKDFDMFHRVIERVDVVDKDNASTLVPMFHYFGMETYLKACDQAFIKDMRWDSCLDMGHDQGMKDCLRNLEHCGKFNLRLSFDEVWTNFTMLLESDEGLDYVNAHLMREVLKVWNE